MNQTTTARPGTTTTETRHKKPGLLDRVLNDIFERELAAYAGPEPLKVKHETVASPEAPAADIVKSAADIVESAADIVEPEIETMTQDNTEFAEDGDADYEDAWSYDTSSHWLSIPEAARVLGRSPRAVERGLSGRWGNRLPDGWSGRRVRLDGVDQWRVVPPAGFRVNAKPGRTADSATYTVSDDNDDKINCRPERAGGEEKNVSMNTGEFTLEKLITSASQLAQKELASLGMALREKSARNEKIYETNDAATIVIDRSDEVERLLRELSDVHKELAEERRARMEDLRHIKEMESSMRLLEDHSRETRELKDDLILAQTALREHKQSYNDFLALPWYKRLFVKKG